MKIIDNLKNSGFVGVDDLKNLNDEEISELLYNIVCMMDENKKLVLEISSLESLENNLRKSLYWTEEENKDLKCDIRELESEKKLLENLIKSAMKNE